MTSLERGFRRIFIVLSLTLLGLGVLLDLSDLKPHATVQVTLKDGRQFTVKRHIETEFMMDRESLARALRDRDGISGEFIPDSQDRPRRRPALRGDIAKDLTIPPPPDWVSAQSASEIVTVQMFQGPSYWWWADFGWTKVTAALVGLLWASFYTVRWIARGFAQK